MDRPPIEVADLVRAAGDAFIERSRKWITWKHVKVLLAILRCRTAALGGHLDECTRCGHRAISYNSCLMGSFFLWGVAAGICAGRAFRTGLGGRRLTINSGACYVVAAINGQCSTRRAHARDILLRAQDVTTLAEWNQWTTHRRVRR